jgi:hypothetical protein
LAGDRGRLFDGESPGLLGPGETDDGVDDEGHEAEGGREKKDPVEPERFAQGADEERDGERPEAEKDAQHVERGGPLVPLVEVARQGVGPAVEPAPAEAEDDRRGQDRPVAGGPREQQKSAGDEESRDGQHGLESEAVDEGAEEERRDQHGEVHRQKEGTGRARPEADALEERGQDGAQDGHDDAEDEDAGPGRGLEPGDAGGSGTAGGVHGHRPFAAFRTRVRTVFLAALKGRA